MWICATAHILKMQLSRMEISQYGNRWLKIKVLQRPLFCSLPSKLVLTCFFVFYLNLAGEHYLILLSIPLFYSLVSFCLSMLLTFCLELSQMVTACMVMYQLDWKEMIH